MPKTLTIRSGGPRILIVDDDADYRASARELLEQEGYEVTEAASGKEALDAVRSGQPDLVVLDVMMDGPDDGYSVNQALKFTARYEDSSEVPILMVSAIEEPPESRFPLVAEAAMIAPDAYMTKPLNVPKFLELVKQLIRRR